MQYNPPSLPERRVKYPNPGASHALQLFITAGRSEDDGTAGSASDPERLNKPPSHSAELSGDFGAPSPYQSNAPCVFLLNHCNPFAAGPHSFDGSPFRRETADFPRLIHPLLCGPVRAVTSRSGVCADCETPPNFKSMYFLVDNLEAL